MSAQWVPVLMWDDGDDQLAFRLMGEGVPDGIVISVQWHRIPSSRYDIAASLRELAGKLEHWRPGTNTEFCSWMQDEPDSDMWNTECGRAFSIVDGTPRQNRMEFCCYCSKPIQQIEAKWPDE